MALTATDLLTLGGIVASGMVLLVVEHYLVHYVESQTGRRLPEQWAYALGLVSAMGIVVAWAAWRSITVDALTALLMLAAACCAGVPDFFLHLHEQRLAAAEQAAAFAELAARHRKLAQYLALRDKLARREKHLSRGENLLLGVTMQAGELRIDIEHLAHSLDQLAELLDPGVGE